ncbi:MAG: sigma-70 family RNA polymerase sigma factor [Clostridia bacterium]|nr:sigma-70 family RNA polymerase sigma factor [Clostridia bacterium]
MSSIKGPDDAQNREATLESLVIRYQAQLLRMCYLFLKDRALAEDAVQETFIKAYKSMTAFRGDCSEKTWLMTIAMNTCRDLRRSGWYRFFDRRVTPDMLPQAAAPCNETDEELALAVMRLPAKLREVILLYYYQGMNVHEIALTLGITQSAVSGRLKRARERLHNQLQRRDDA